MQVDTLILGAGAAGMMCAARCGRGGPVLVVDHARAPGEKIRISGGGRCNFTNLGTGPGNFLSANPHFAKSALRRYGPRDFLALVDRHGIAWHEKTLGQLFCDGKATQIVDMLRAEMARAGAELRLSTRVTGWRRTEAGFAVTLDTEGRVTTVQARRLVLATGGRSIPRMGATGLALDIARDFGLAVTPTRPALVPLTFPEGRFAALAGVSLPVCARAGGARFEEALLFTHRGLSGPAILQASSYWREGESLRLDLTPGHDLFATLRAQRGQSGRRNLTTELAQHLPARLVEHLAAEWRISGNLADQSDRALRALCDRLAGWEVTPSGSEGWRTAEVMLGGIDTAGLSSTTMEARAVPGLYAIGEAVDVTVLLVGYNFQWAWSSAMAAARALGQPRSG